MAPSGDRRRGTSPASKRPRRGLRLAAGFGIDSPGPAGRASRFAPWGASGHASRYTFPPAASTSGYYSFRGTTEMAGRYSIGVDYGTNSVRALVVDTATGEEIASHVFDFPSGDAGILLDPRDPNLA